MVLNQLIKGISKMNQREGQEQAEDRDSQKILYIMKLPADLDANLLFFLNSVKTALLLRTNSMRLLLTQNDKLIAGRDSSGKKMQGSVQNSIYQITDLTHFLTPRQFDEQVRFLMNGTLLLCNK